MKEDAMFKERWTGFGRRAIGPYVLERHVGEWHVFHQFKNGTRAHTNVIGTLSQVRRWVRVRLGHG